AGAPVDASRRSGSGAGDRPVQAGGDVGEDLVDGLLGEALHERLDLHGAGVPGGADRSHEPVEVDHPGVVGQAAVEVHLLVARSVGAGVVDVDGDDVGGGEAGEVLGGLPGGKPVVAVEDQADVARAGLRDEGAGVGDVVDEGVALGGPEGLRPDVLQPEPQPVVGEALGEQGEPSGVQAPVGGVVAGPVHGADPGADRGDPGGGEQPEGVGQGA